MLEVSTLCTERQCFFQVKANTEKNRSHCLDEEGGLHMLVWWGQYLQSKQTRLCFLQTGMLIEENSDLHGGFNVLLKA